MTPRAPHPTVLAQTLTAAAAAARNDGDRARRMAALLAARGYPTGTLGTGTHTTTSSTSTERAALNPDQWATALDDLDRDTRLLWALTERYLSRVARLLAHASDDDPIPAARGNCRRCDVFCKGDGGNDRLRYGGLCHRCSSALRRYRSTRPDATVDDFIRTTKETAA